MTNPPPKFAVGNIVHCVATMPGQKPSPQQYKIIAVYTNLSGDFFIGEAIGGIHPGSQDVLLPEHYEVVK